MGKKMNQDYEQIEEMLRNKRDDLSKGSLRTYARVLHSFNKRMYDDSFIDGQRYIEDKEKIIKDLADKKPNSIRTLLSAIILITEDNQFRQLMSQKIYEHRKFIDKNEMTEKQKENWISKEEVEEKLMLYKKMSDSLYKRLTFPKVVVQSIQDYIILCLCCGEYIAPRRSTDFCNMKIRLTKKEMEKNDCNYMAKGKFVFNDYKTAKTYGQQVIDIPRKLQLILKKWMTVNDTDFLLINSNGQQLTPTTLGQRLTEMFGKRVGTTSFRRLFLTDKYENTIKEMKELEEDMKDMGSSKAQANHYIKDTSELDKKKN